MRDGARAEKKKKRSLGGLFDLGPAVAAGQGVQDGPGIKQADALAGDGDDAAKKVFKITRADLKKHGKSRLLPTWETFKAALLDRVETYNAAPHRALPRIEESGHGPASAPFAQRVAPFSSF